MVTGVFADAVRGTCDLIGRALCVEVPEVEDVAALAEDEGRMWLSAFAAMPEFACHTAIEES